MFGCVYSWRIWYWEICPRIPAVSLFFNHRKIWPSTPTFLHGWNWASAGPRISTTVLRTLLTPWAVERLMPFYTLLLCLVSTVAPDSKFSPFSLTALVQHPVLASFPLAILWIPASIRGLSLVYVLSLSPWVSLPASGSALVSQIPGNLCLHSWQYSGYKVIQTTDLSHTPFPSVPTGLS